MRLHHLSKYAFTLVELAVVTIIIGIILSSVLIGRHVYNSTKLNNIYSELQSYSTAIQQFSIQYQQLPGDLNKASTYWPSQCHNQCDGNGDRYISDDVANEDLLALFHLKLASLITQNVSGRALDHQKRYEIGYNTFSSAYSSQSAITIKSHKNSTSKLYYINGHAIHLGRLDQQGNNDLGLLPATKAQQLDIKYDDGIANEGSLVAVNANNQNKTCTKKEEQHIFYLNNNTKNNCQLVFWHKVF